jgi:predicted nucleic acid-binding protein
MIGFDSSFFFAYVDGNSDAVRTYRAVMEDGRPAALSSITLFELRRHSFRGAIERDFVDEVIAITGVAFMQAGVDDVAVLDRAARIAHGMGLATADALIAASLEQIGCTRLHTTDTDFEAYEGPMDVAFL